MAFCKNLYPFHELFLQAFLDSASKQTSSCSGISGRNQIGYLSRKQRYEWHAALSQCLALHLIFCSRSREARLPTASPNSMSHSTCRIIPERGSVAVYDVEGGHRVWPSMQESRRPSCITICLDLIKDNPNPKKLLVLFTLTCTSVIVTRKWPWLHNGFNHAT